jgi:outer membrane immunogenic protein
LAGGHLGYNWQYGRLVGGLEADFDAADIKSTANLAAINPPPAVSNQMLKIDELASVRVRLGWEVRPDLLAYGTGGMGFGNGQAGITQTAPYLFIERNGLNEFGWVAGAGFEYKLLDRWLLRAEYLHYDFGRVTSLNDSLTAAAPIDSSLSRTTVDVVRGGLSYKF